MRETAFLTRGLQDHADRRAWRGPPGRVPLRGRDRRLRPLPEREQGPDPAQGRLLRGRERGGRARGGHAVELLLPGVGLLVRQQHQHDRGRRRICRGFRSALDRRAEQVRARQGLPQGEGRQPGRRGRARGLDRGRSRPSSPIPQFEGQTKTKLGNPGMQSFVQSVVYARLNEFLEENPQDARAVLSKAVSGRSGPGGGAQGAGSHPAQVGARELDPARQAVRLLGQGSVAGRAVHRRGRLGRRLGGERAGPQHPGHPAAAGQDPQRREEPDRQGPRPTPRSRP